MTLELVRTHTSDGLRLDGSCQASPLPASRRADLALLLPGVGGNFYGGALFDGLAPRLLQVGVSVLRVNTRGHDSVSIASGSGGPKWQGAAYETVADCVLDIAAWCQWATTAGYQRVVLLGHSLGAIKALYAAAHQLPENVTAVVAASPPRLSYSAFQHAPQSSIFLDAIRTAQQLVEQNQPEKLFVARFPFPLLISAASYLDKYGPQERYHILDFLDRITIPTLFTYGQIELEQGGVAFAGMPEAIAHRRRPGQPLHIETIPAADHFYNGTVEPLADVVDRWLASGSDLHD